MHPEAKKLGELLVEAQLITAIQLQEALRHQRLAGGRMGSNLVNLGFISEDVLMDFLSRQTGVPRMDLRHVEVPIQALERIPKRLAEQMNILPVALKEPKSLVLAMADPSDLNAIDSARFASGMNIEPVVATHSALKAAVNEQYRKLEILTAKPADTHPRPGGAISFDEGLPVALEVGGLGMEPHNPSLQTGAIPIQHYPKDPFFDEVAPKVAEPPAAFFGADPRDPFEFMAAVPPAQDTPVIVHDRTTSVDRIPRLANYQTRTLVMGLIRLLQRRGVLSEEELARLIQNLIDAKEIRDE